MLTWHQGKADTLGECCQEQVTFHHGKVLADADARACAKERQAFGHHLVIAHRLPFFIANLCFVVGLFILYILVELSFAISGTGTSEWKSRIVIILRA